MKINTNGRSITINHTKECKFKQFTISLTSHGCNNCVHPLILMLTCMYTNENPFELRVLRKFRNATLFMATCTKVHVCVRKSLERIYNGLLVAHQSISLLGCVE